MNIVSSYFLFCWTNSLPAFIQVNNEWMKNGATNNCCFRTRSESVSLILNFHVMKMETNAFEVDDEWTVWKGLVFRCIHTQTHAHTFTPDLNSRDVWTNYHGRNFNTSLHFEIQIASAADFENQRIAFSISGRGWWMGSLRLIDRLLNWATERLLERRATARELMAGFTCTCTNGPTSLFNWS